MTKKIKLKQNKKVKESFELKDEIHSVDGFTEFDETKGEQERNIEEYSEDESDDESIDLDEIDEFGFLKSFGTEEKEKISVEDNIQASESEYDKSEDSLDDDHDRITATTPSTSYFSDDSDADDFEQDDALDELHAAIGKALEPVSQPKGRKKKTVGIDLANINANQDFPTQASSKKITLDDIKALTSSNTLVSKSLARLEELDKRAKGVSEIVKARQGRRLEQRIDRAAAYEITKDEVSKWEDTVKRNREAEGLQFPLQKVENGGSGGVRGDLDDEDELEIEMKAGEVLEGRKLTLDEVASRRNELRHARELMFREERRARRIKKIKSKSYHKVHKREKERDAERAKQLNEEDSENREDDYEAQVKRAQERMSQRHRNNTKWAKDMKKMNLNKDSTSREELEEMLRRGEELKKKIDGQDSDSSDEEVLNEQNDEKLEVTSKKGILAMKFMQDAEARLRKENDEAIAELRRVESGHVFLRDDEGGTSATHVINEGRRRYAPGGEESRNSLNEVIEKAEEEENESASGLQKKLKSVEVRTLSARENRPNHDKKVTANPWINEVDDGSVTKGGSLLTLSADSSKSQKAEAKLKRAKKRAQRAKKAAGADGDADVHIDVNQILEVRSAHDEYDDGAETNVADSQVMLIQKGTKRLQPAEFEQRNLVKRAFAGDNVVEEFEEEKSRVVEDEGDKEIDVTLPGWGSWTGKGTGKPKKKFVEKIAGIALKDRKDARLKNVIINEKAAKKSAKYLVGQVPFPYENREQYERAMRMPLGKEWATQTMTQKLTKPKIIVKPGVVIEPLNAPFGV
ncbi:small-subunit processome [Lipomyces japonicus]|uniref:small-subunit processome n=1 Tax=Lipomyces japonicus TaxID=56871 RepID=UPI0034CEDD94